MSKDSPNLDQARQPYIQSLVETMEMYGLSPTLGRLYGIMFFHNAPMTLDEMCAHTGMSKTSMSTGMRELSRVQLVQKKWEKGFRKDLYEAEHDLFGAFVDYFAHLWSEEISLTSKGLLETQHEITRLIENNELTPEDQELAYRDLKKLEEAKRYYSWLNELSRTVASGKIFDLIPMPGKSNV